MVWRLLALLLLGVVKEMLPEPLMGPLSVMVPLAAVLLPKAMEEVVPVTPRVIDAVVAIPVRSEERVAPPAVWWWMCCRRRSLVFPK